MAGQGHTPLISLVVSFHNDGEAIDRFFAGVIPVLEAVDDIRFEIVCVNDGSEDGTLDRLVSFGVRDPRVRVIDLTRSFGKEAALTAGLDEANGDAVIPIDANLQDWPSRIPTMIAHWRSGAQGGVAWRYRDFALEAIRRFSTEPHRSWTWVGLTIAALACLYGGFIVGRTIMDAHPAPSYAAVISSMLFIGGMELIGIGVVGGYIGRLDDEPNRDPIYLVRRRYQARSNTARFRSS
jgi:glycosyltransferase involved in cell wall biosynthesis